MHQTSLEFAHTFCATAFGLASIAMTAATGYATPCQPGTPVSYSISYETALETLVCEDGRAPAVATDALGRFVVGFAVPPPLTLNPRGPLYAVRFEPTGTAICSPSCPTELSDTGSGSQTSAHDTVSVAMSLGSSPGNSPLAGFSWTASYSSGVTLQYLLSTSSYFDPFAPQAQGLPGPSLGTNPSAALWRTTANNPGSAIVWASTTGPTHELRYNVTSSGGSGSGALSSSPYTTIAGKWSPCVAQDAAGNTVVVWAEPEEALNELSNFDIGARRFDGTGAPIGSSLTVNTSKLGNQLSPAVAIDSNGRVVVVWYGPGVTNCGGPFITRIFGQELQLTGSGLQLVGPEFIVDSATNATVNTNPGDASPPLPNPTVTWAPTPENPSRFVVAWNTYVNTAQVNEVHAQYFTYGSGGPLAIFKEFSIPRQQGWSGLPGRETRTLGGSGQHTLAAGPDGALVATWFRKNVNSQPPQDGLGSYVTVLPPAADAALCCAETCLRGDANQDGHVNGLDTQDFIEIFFAGGFMTWYPCGLVNYSCVIDIDGDCKLTESDRMGFICLLLGGEGCTKCANSNIVVGAPESGDAAAGGATAAAQPGGPQYSLAHRDCNGNGQADADELAAGVAPDCNLNGVPDECDLGFDPAVTDANRNMIPDECEATAMTAAAPAVYHVGSGYPCPNGEAILAEFAAWSATVDWPSVPAWRQGYEMKQKLAEFGIAMQ